MPTTSQQAEQQDLCNDGLAAANQTMNSVDNVNAVWDTIQSAADANNIDPSLLAAIAVRESGGNNVSESDGAGVGVGVFQLTVSPTSGVTFMEASDTTWAANYAAGMLSSNMNQLDALFPSYAATGTLTQATAASYNMGIYNQRTGGLNFTGNPDTIDQGTAGPYGGNYGSNVVDLMNCF
jgi:hypothetical protein